MVYRDNGENDSPGSIWGPGGRVGKSYLKRIIWGIVPQKKKATPFGSCSPVNRDIFPSEHG